MDFFLRQIKPPDVQEKYMIEEKEATEHGVTLVDASLLLDEGFGLFGSFTDNVTWISGTKAKRWQLG